jgi:inorganic pyrophosphatase
MEKEIEVIVEITKGTHIKYEYDKDKNIIVCDRVLHTPMKYPFNYGFVPDTLSEDGDPLDVVILMDDELIPGCSIKCKILGYLETKDDEGNDPKLIVCPIGKIDPIWNHTTNLTEIFNVKLDDNHILNKIKYFFQHYKDLEKKRVIVGDFYNYEHAYQIYIESIDRYVNKGIQKNKITNYYKKI